MELAKDLEFDYIISMAHPDNSTSAKVTWETYYKNMI